MKKFLMMLPVVAFVAACDTENQSTLTGAAVGAAAGAAVSGDDDRVVGALIGGAAGAAAGNYIGRANNGQCVYQNPNGTRYTAACP
ncbi:glycine zipper 2TM domain-containing protein [Sulfitobacter sp. S190]|uniref:glycine zipper 2TM domain-containing protein n=1 Tax=Sulfitobacter sp. S190 TaxID=2867022 RepID=UPI0021A279CE|nr:glycine zipper 2TM domain-containing protein [Sulfitobacter sp. S190]UWR22766.1 glycine zipper 2TM domain-containing protein [Sulfitobacter sp. S190]